MRFIDPHVHMYSRTTDDYESMVLCGIECVVEPSFWVGNDRRYAGTFFDYFNHISLWEPENRAAKRHMRHFCMLAVNPKEAEHLALAREVLAGLAPYLERPTVVGIGEIGFNNITPNEEQVLRDQLLLARKLDLPVIVHTPHNNKLEGTLRIIAICEELKMNPARIDIDHNTEETMGASLEHGFWAGITMYPRTKCTPQRARDMVERFGATRVLLNSSCDWETSDPLAVPKAARLMLQTGFSQAQTRGVVWENPYQFLSQAENFRRVMEPVFRESGV